MHHVLGSLHFCARIRAAYITAKIYTLLTCNVVTRLYIKIITRVTMSSYTPTLLFGCKSLTSLPDVSIKHVRVKHCCCVSHNTFKVIIRCN